MNTEQLTAAALKATPATSREAFEARMLSLYGYKAFLPDGTICAALEHRWADWQAAIEWASKRAQEACDKTPAPAACNVLEKGLWGVAMITAGEAIKEALS